MANNLQSGSPSDEYALQEVLSGQTDSFRVIVERYQDLVFGIGMRFFHNEEDARDLAQEVFVRAFRNLSGFKFRAPFRFWLTRLAYNFACSRLVSKKDDSSLAVEIVSHGRLTEEEISRTEVSELLRTAVDGLPDEYRVCIDLYFYGGFSQSEISEITGITAGTIKSHVYRAKRMLRDELRGTIAEDYYEM